MAGNNDRGQAYTLEGVIAAILIASALVLGIQAVDIQPWADDGPEQGDQLRIQVEDALDIAADEGALQEATTCVTEDDGTYVPDPRGTSTSESGTALGTILNNTLDETASYTVSIMYKNQDTAEFERQPLTGQQSPLGSSVSVTRQFSLYKSDVITEFNSTESTCVVSDSWDDLEDLNEGRDLYLGDPVEDGDDLYAVVRLEVRAW